MKDENYGDLKHCPHHSWYSTCDNCRQILKMNKAIEGDYIAIREEARKDAALSFIGVVRMVMLEAGVDEEKCDLVNGVLTRWGLREGWYKSDLETGHHTGIGDDPKKSNKDNREKYT